MNLILTLIAVAGAALLSWWIAKRSLGASIAELQGQLERARIEGEAMQRMASAGRAAAGLAHEIGNPLCAITNYAHSLEDKVAPELKPAVLSLQREVGRIERMTDGITDYVRPRSPGRTGSDVNEALRSTLSFLGDQGIFRRITLDEQLDSAPLPVKGTALELEQAFANLLLNAVDAMPGGGQLAIRTKRVPRMTLVDGTPHRAGDEAPPVPGRRDERMERWIATHEMAQIVKVVVADSGHGVRRGEEERIFEPFVSSKSREHGTGLGLAIVRGLVNGMGGIVWVQGSREGGAGFHMALPVYAGEEAPPR